MDKHLYIDKGAERILAIVRPDGYVTFHNEAGFEVKDPVNIMTQDATVKMLREQGFKEVPQ